MKKLYCLALALLPMSVAAQSLVVTLRSGEQVKYEIADISRLSFDDELIDPVNPEDIADSNLKEALNAFDLDGDGVLSAAEIAEIEELNLNYSQVADLTGIQKLVNLKKLSVMSCPNLTSIDLTGLDKLEFLQCGFSSNLTDITFGEKPVLKEVYAMYTGLKSADFSQCPAIETITVASTAMTTVDLSNHTALRKFTAGSDVLESVNLDGCTELRSITLNSVSLFPTFDISAFPELEDFTMTGSKVGRFETTNNKNLKSLTLDYSDNLYYLDVSKSLKLNTLSCLSCWELYSVIMTEGQTIANTSGIYDYMITRVPREYPEDVASVLEDETFRNYMLGLCDTDNDGKISEEEAKALTTIDASNQGLSSVDFSFFGNLVEVNLSGNALTSIDLSSIKNVETLNLSDNQITSLDFAGLSSLKYLNASNNQLETISKFAGYGLVEVDLSHNKLSTVNITYQGSLKKCDVSYNQLTTADILQNAAMTDMNVSNNQLTEMTMWSLKGLVNVDFSNNPFIQLNEANRWTKLETINCSGTNIPTLDLSKTEVLTKCVATSCPNLTTIYAGSNTEATIEKDETATVVYGSPE